MSETGNIKVAVRCRPLNSREKERGATCLIRMEGNQTIITKPAGEGGKPDTKVFAYDYSYWSFDPQDPNYASQDIVYNDLGKELLEHAFNGYNTCLFAYGQTGAGKSYSMMGYGEDKGIVPKTCQGLFERISQVENCSFRVEVSYMEIYCERVKDLLKPSNKALKVREHPVLGPYVEDLSKIVVNSFEEIETLMDEGNKLRTVASTNMNATSSRSHGVVTIILTQAALDNSGSEKVSKISLVDLAGSERANSTGATGTLLKEGANINKSLTTLGKVISALSAGEDSKETGKRKRKDAFVPYRDSVLTWLLKDSLGGNSKTIMIAAISPTDYDETLSTLRYAYQAKRIQNKAVINEDPNTKMLRQMKEELMLLRSRLHQYDPNDELLKGIPLDPKINLPAPVNPAKKRQSLGLPLTLNSDDASVIREQLMQSEKIVSELNKDWEEKIKESQEISKSRERILEEMGIAVEKGSVGVHTPKNMPHLVNLNEDPLMNECLIYQLKPGRTRVGNLSSDAEIKLSGKKIGEAHCWFENEGKKVKLHPNEAYVTMVNGRVLDKPKLLRSGYRIIIGGLHIFRFNHPEEVRVRQREQKRKSLHLNQNLSLSSDTEDSTKSAEAVDHIDWNFALDEAGIDPEDDAVSQLSIDSYEVVKLQQAKEDLQKQFEEQKKQYDLNKLNFTPVEEYLTKVNKEMVSARQQMQKELEVQRREFEEQMKRIVKGEEVTRIYTPKEKQLIQWTLQKLKSRHTFRFTETLLANTVVLKEANVISKQLGKKVVYQFCLADDSLRTTSSLETVQLLGDHDGARDGRAQIAVQVIDRKNESSYVWSLTELKARLDKMRKLVHYADRPDYARHLNLEDPFYQSPGPDFTFIGSAKAYLLNVIAMTPQSFKLPVICRRSGLILGRLAVSILPFKQIKPLYGPPNTLIPASDAKNFALAEQLPKKLDIGSRLTLKVNVNELVGVSEMDFSQMHCQFRLSDFGGVPVGSSLDSVFSTEAVGGFGSGKYQDGTICFNYRKTIPLTVTEEVLTHLKNGFLTVEVFGQPQPLTMLAWEQGDNMLPSFRKRHAYRRRPSFMPGTVEKPLPADLSSKEELIMNEESHDLIVQMKVLELSPKGMYEPALLEGEVFGLQQGAQRRILLKMTHSSGRLIEWEKISGIELGNFTFTDCLNEINCEKVALTIVPGSQQIEGSSLQVEATWDSSQHHCDLLNITSRLSLTGRLSWKVCINRSAEPLTFALPLSLKIGQRQGVFSQVWSVIGKPLQTLQRRNITKLFTLQLSPPTTKRLAELWKVNTVHTYVRGEEFLGSWRPRGVNVIKEYFSVKERINKLEEVERTRQLLALFEFLDHVILPTRRALDSAPEKVCEQVIGLWIKAKPVKHNELFSLIQESAMVSKRKTSFSTAMTAKISSVLLDPMAVMQGWMNVYVTTGDYWERRWLVMKRPYVLIYSDEKGTELCGVINLTLARVCRKFELESILEQPNVFAIYTRHNSFILQTPVGDDVMNSWIKVIDPWFHVLDMRLGGRAA